MFKNRIVEDLKNTVKDLGFEEVDIVCSIPKNSEHGDYTTNIALQLANQKSSEGKQNAQEIASKIVTRIRSLESSKEYLEKVEVAGSGFINFFIKPTALLQSLRNVCNYSSLVNPDLEIDDEKKKILLEYASFNALKPIHVGHMRNITLGEAVSRLLVSQGNEVFRVTYTSDIGLPSAKVIWALMQDLGFKEAKKKPLIDRINYLGQIYVKGNSAFEKDEKYRDEIREINTQIYQREPKVTVIWQEVLQWTFEYFQQIYSLVGSKFDKEILESEVEKRGSEIVQENLGKVFREDQGAIIFPGSEFGLHNRVFISSAGNPTYEAKDLGLAEVEYDTFNFNQAIHVVANDQDDYFKVVFKALEQINPDLAKKEQHLSYGYVVLSSGKMSSRKGNVVTMEDVYDQIHQKVSAIVAKNRHPELVSGSQIQEIPGQARNDGMTLEEKQEVAKMVSVGAMKFSILKYASHTDITFDLEKSVSLSGDSGPYIQYSFARAKSVLRNAQFDYQVDLPHGDKHPKTISKELEKEERLLLQKIEHFESIVTEAADNYAPNVLAEYLLGLASNFNLFYQKHPIIKAEGDSVDLRLALTCSVAVILKQGLYLLGIDSPERM